MRKLLTLLTTLLVVALAYSQTNVSGGIYTNTTWTKANSPYIVTDTVVVFPGVTLTIEPGVTVMFAMYKRLEIRQGILIASGTSSDSINFVSNNGSLTPGTWGEVFLNGPTNTDTLIFNYCNFRAARSGIYCPSDYALVIKNCNFSYNTIGLNAYNNQGPNDVFIDSCFFGYNTDYGMNLGQGKKRINFCTISNNGVGIGGVGQNHGPAAITDCNIQGNGTGLQANGYLISNCNIINNQKGTSECQNTFKNCNISNNAIFGLYSAGDTIVNCQIKNNGIGLRDWPNADPNYVTGSIIEDNTTGIKIEGSIGNQITQVFCNRICNNSSYNLYYNESSSNASFANNFWCLNDALAIGAKIYDGYDDISLGLANFTPFDTLGCYAGPCSAFFHLFPDTAIQHNYFAINMATGVGALSYLWSWGDGTYDSIAYPNHTYASQGLYTICLSITDSLNCSSTYCYEDFYLQHSTNTMVHVSVYPGINTGIVNARNPSPDFSLYPNPSNGKVTINVDEQHVGSTVTLTDLTGRVVLKSEIENPRSEISMATLPSGIYLAVLTTPNGQRAVRKVVKE